jgi:two-component system chemotaxis sensor kinase CheA
MNEFVEQFLLECRELVAQATDDLIALEENSADRERIDSTFRAFHTLKGAAGIVEFAAMGRMLHVAEDLLSATRASETVIRPSVISECLTALDMLSRWLDAMEGSGEVPPTAEAEADQMIARLLLSADIAPVAGAAPAPADDDDDGWLATLRAEAGQAFGRARTAIRYRPDEDAYLRGEDPLALIAGVPGLLHVATGLRDPAASLATMDPYACALDIRALSSAGGDDVARVLVGVRDQLELRSLAAPAEATAAPDLARTLLTAQLALLQETTPDGFKGRLASAGRSAVNVLRHVGNGPAADEVGAAAARAIGQNDAAPLVAALEQVLGLAAAAPRAVAPDATLATVSVVAPRALRVDMDRIDALVKLSGELIVVKNALGHAARMVQDGGDPAAAAAAVRRQHALFERLTAELQGAVLRIRVLPLRTVFRRFPKLVRETAVSVGKTVRLVTEGDATEADATIVDALFEPLLHVLRNAVDHGIEDAARRTEAGKSTIGTITLRARRDADGVMIEIEDDGGGIDAGRVREVAQARGIAGQGVLDAMTDAEAIDLVFAAGFSTAATVTNLSGRGVGMDSVRTAVGQLGGQVSLDSRPGLGTTVRMVLPFSLMLTRVMTVEAGGQSFALPLDTIVETTIIDRDRISAIGAGRAFALRDRTVPLIDLAETLGLVRDAARKPQAKIVVLSSAGQLGALEVDRLGERMDVMLKPMEGLLGGMRGVAGTTLLGDGRVLVVLDVAEIFQ